MVWWCVHPRNLFRRENAPFHERKSEMKGRRSSASVASHLILAWPRTGFVFVSAHPTVRIPCGWKQIRECELGGICLKPGLIGVGGWLDWMVRLGCGWKMPPSGEALPSKMTSWWSKYLAPVQYILLKVW